jgi:hypothetical protein
MRGGGVRGDETAPPYPRQIFEKLVNKNAIKPKLGAPPGIFPDSLDPPRDFLQKLQVPPPLYVHLWYSKEF